MDISNINGPNNINTSRVKSTNIEVLSGSRKKFHFRGIHAIKCIGTGIRNSASQGYELQTEEDISIKAAKRQISLSVRQSVSKGQWCPRKQDSICDTHVTNIRGAGKGTNHTEGQIWVRILSKRVGYRPPFWLIMQVKYGPGYAWSLSAQVFFPLVHVLDQALYPLPTTQPRRDCCTQVHGIAPEMYDTPTSRERDVSYKRTNQTGQAVLKWTITEQTQC